MKNLTEGSIFKTLLTYSAPIVLGDMLQASYGIIDALWVGRLIGADALAAISSAGPIMFLIVALVIGIAIATVIMVGQAYGMGDMKFLEKILVNSYMTVAIMCVIISTLSIIFSGSILKLINTPEILRPDAQKFLIIIFSGLIFMFSFNWFSGVLRGLGDSKTPFMLLIISIIINIILAPVLITGAFGLFPRLGISGSALATVISQLLTTVFAFIYLAKKNVLLNLFKWKYEFDFSIVKKMFQIGVPVSVQMIINAFSAIIIISFVNKFGPDVIAAFGIGMRVDSFSYMPAMSLGSSVSAMVAQHIGAGKSEKIPSIMFNAMLISLGVALLFYIPVNLFPGQIAQLFTGRASVGAALKTYFNIDSVTYFAFAAMFAIQGVIRGAGDTIPLTIFAFISLIIFRAGIAWALISTTNMHESGIWVSMVISAYIGMIISFWYYKTGKWKEKSMLKTKQASAPSA